MSIIPKRKGYTLVELLVSIAIFMIIIVAPAGFLISSLNVQQKTLFSQEILDNISYSSEYMSRALRMAKKDIDGNCITQNANYQITRNGNGIKFLNYNSVCQEFYLDAVSSRMMEIRGAAIGVPLTGQRMQVVSFKIYPSDGAGWSQNDHIQPKITLFFEIKGIMTKKPESQPLIKIQTSVSQRNLDVQI